MDSFPKEQIGKLCKQFGPLLHTPEGINGVQLLWAIAGNESSFGANCRPRHEPAYDVGGKYADHKLLEAYGSDAACSYNAWQIMFPNAPGFTPKELREDPEKACIATVGFLNRRIFDHLKAKDLDEVAHYYNGGGDPSYAPKLKHNYLCEILG